MKFVKISAFCICLSASLSMGLKADDSGYVRLDKAGLESKRQSILNHQATRPVTQAEGSAAAAEARKPLGASTILSAYGCWTFVPEGSVIHVPESLQGNIVPAPRGTLIPFPEFLAKNIAWLTTRELKMDEIVGDTPLSEGVINAMSASGRIVVATISNSPVTFGGQSN